jgi:capsule polysaccharide export protein KpsE/RkpR
VSKSLKTQQASFQRQFIERRYNQNIQDLKETENRLKTFQEENGMISLPEQTRVAIETAALLKGQVLSNEVQLGVMESTLTPGHPDMDRVQKEIKELNIQLSSMDAGSKIKASGSSNLFPAFSEVPELGVQLMRLSRF